MERLFNAPEIVILVFQSCDNVGDGLSLALACRFLASIWRTHATAILGPLLEAQITGFSQALLAVRATNLVRHAFQANELPPRPADLLELVRARKPDMGELKQVRDLQHLARCVEHMSRRGTVPSQMQIGNEDHWLFSAARTRMRSRFHCAIYRVLFVGAALAREYFEPLFLAPIQGPPGCLSRLSSLGKDEEHDELVGLAQEDIEYLEKFPVYALDAGQDKWEPAFGDLATWLLDDIETTFTSVQTSEYGDDSIVPATGELGPLQEVTFFLAAYEHLTDKLFSEYLFYPGANRRRRQPPFPGRVRKASAVILGIFCPEEVSMPVAVEDSAACYLVNERLAFPEQPTPWAAEINCLLGTMYEHTDGETLRNGFPAPPPALRFVDFVLAKFFKLRFKDDLFDTDSPRHGLMQYHQGFLQNSGLFGDHSIIWTTWLFAEVEGTDES